MWVSREPLVTKGVEFQCFEDGRDYLWEYFFFFHINEEIDEVGLVRKTDQSTLVCCSLSHHLDE